jgi:uncharacterized protein
MKIDNPNTEYLDLVSHILNNPKFDETKDIVHHGLNRYDHSLRVSYYSYRIAKALRINYEDAARGALLHDFFISSNNCSYNSRFKSIFRHPKQALENASKHFALSDIEADIIKKHMFPLTISPPKYLESWIVDIVDDIVSIAEQGYLVRKQLTAITNFALIMLIGYLK